MVKAAVRTIFGGLSFSLLTLASGCDQAASSGTASSAVQASSTTAQVAQAAPPPAPSRSAPAPTTPSRTATPDQPVSGDGHQHGGSTPIPVVLGQPPIEFDPPVLDLGQVRPNQRVSGTIYIQNLSDKALKILSSKADCTCTTVDLANTVIGPGERISFRADYNSSAAMGVKGSAVRVKIDGYDPAEVGIKAFVTMPVKAEP